MTLPMAADVPPAMVHCCRCKCGPPFYLWLPKGKAICEACQKLRFAIQDKRWRMRKSWVTPYLDGLKEKRMNLAEKIRQRNATARAAAMADGKHGIFDYSI